MKKFFCIYSSFIFSMVAISQPGKYAGTKKFLIGEKYTDTRDITAFKTWLYRGGSVITPLENPEMIKADIFQKGATCVVLFSVNEDTASNEFMIADVLEVKGVTKTQEIKTGLCRDNKEENIELIALVRSENKEYSKAIRAWQFDRSKRRVSVKNAATVDCLNEGYDQY